MKITIDEETEALLEGERAARGLRSPTAAAKAIIKEAAEAREWATAAAAHDLAKGTKKGRTK